jgi:hypothetical protein|nr:MAG TPA: bacteriocin [Crassvirales sp.]
MAETKKADKFQKGVGIASGAIGATTSLLGNLGGGDEIEAQADAQVDQTKTQMSKSALSGWIADWQPQSDESMGLAGFSGALSGASAGSAAGPWGALAGGIAGLAGGLFGASNRNRQREEANRRVSQAMMAQNTLLSQKEAQDALANIVAFGGWVGTHGGDYPTGFSEFNEGGSHETNANGGILQGIDPNGNPNLVEEGETKWDNYIFSKRLKVPKGFGKAYDLGRVDKKSYADASKKLSKESEERPFDPISTRGRDAMLGRLQQAQEAQKYIDKADEAMNEIFDINELGDILYAEGGGIHIKPSKRGTFTAAAKKHGKGVQEFARQVLANKENYSSAMVKKANFARNASKWHDGGGWLQSAGLFAPALANVGNLVSDIVSKPEQASLGRMDLSPYITRRRLPYEPIDREYMANKYRAQAGATARGIVDSSAGNPASARAALVAHNYNALNALGDMYIKSDEVNRQRKKESIMFDAEQDRQLAALSGQQQQFNLGQELREYDINARNRAARRNGIRTGVNTVAGNIGETSRYLQNLETIQNMFPLYGTPTGRFTGGVDAPTPTRTTIDPKTTWDFLDTPSNYGAKGGFLFDPEVEKFLKSIKKGGK